jgi:hypothetical protein
MTDLVVGQLTACRASFSLLTDNFWADCTGSNTHEPRCAEVTCPVGLGCICYSGKGNGVMTGLGRHPWV